MIDNPQPPAATRTVLDDYLTAWAAHCAKTVDVNGVGQLGHVLCDIGLGLMAWHAEPWCPLLSTSRRQFLLHEAIQLLHVAGRFDEAFILSQRMKGLVFALPTLQRYARRDAPPAPMAVRPALQCLRELRLATSSLLTATKHTVSERVIRLLKIGQRVTDAMAEVRAADRTLHARLGGVIAPDDLIDAFPTFDPVGIVDMVTASRGTVMQILVRRGARVERVPAVVPGLTAMDAMRLDEFWSQRGLTHGVFDDRRRREFTAVCEQLHDRIGCGLAAKLAELTVTQVVLVPDAYTRRVPLHLASLCAKEIDVAGVDTSGAEHFCEKFPVEYAPAIQAVVVSQDQKRPRELGSVVSLADPGGDLPAARASSAFLASRVGAGLTFREHLGPRATVGALREALRSASVIMIGAHGRFDPAEPTKSGFDMADRRWTLADMIDSEPLTGSPVVLLCACEVGAAASGDEPAAGGIPATLLSRGAASVLGALWPIEDFSAGFLVERFLHHLAHRGLSPAAALFRAVRNLRAMTRAEALDLARRRLDELAAESQKPEPPDRIGESIMFMDDLCQRLESLGPERPFAGPEYWGALVVVGCGWHSPQGAMVGDAHAVIRNVEAMLDRESIDDLLSRGEFKTARAKLEDALTVVDGLERARTLDALAWVVWCGRSGDRDRAALTESLDLLRRASEVARADGAAQLLRNIGATESKIRLAYED